MPPTANLFKDTDHPFRWFLAPYAEIYLIRAESLDIYKSMKPAIKAWVDARISSSSSSMKKNSWLLLFVPTGTPSSLDSYNKVYSRLSSDFYAEKAGDRSIFLLLSQEYTALSLEVPAQHNTSVVDFLARLKKCIATSFHNRTTLYDADIRRLDSFRGTPQLDFRQLFLVKESLALMYQMMQLPSESFIQYEELEALLSFAPPGHLPDNEWPMVTTESSKSASKHQVDAAADANALQADSKEKEIDETAVFNTPCRLGDEVLVYSINSSRMKILKNKMGVAELHRYLFARQMYFLSILRNPTNFAQKGLSFLVGAMTSIHDRLQKRQASDAADTPGRISLRRKQGYLWGICSSVQIVKAFFAMTESLITTTATAATAANTNNITTTSALPPASAGPNNPTSKEPSQFLCEILLFTLSMLKNITSISSTSANLTLKRGMEGLEATCWLKCPDPGNTVTISSTMPPTRDSNNTTSAMDRFVESLLPEASRVLD